MSGGVVASPDPGNDLAASWLTPALEAIPTRRQIVHEPRERVARPDQSQVASGLLTHLFEKF